jgi:actin-like ATPase involved in cell morphogenesis
MKIGVGIDVGHSHVKVAKGSDTAMARTCVWPAREGDDPSIVKKRQDALVELRGERFWVGDMAVIQSCGVAPSLLEDEWIGHQSYAVLMLWGYHMACRLNSGNPIEAIGLGLPASAFSRDKKRVREMAAELLERDPKTIHVIPQPYAAYLGYVWLPSGQINDGARKQKHVGIIDVGFGTTDMGLVQEGVWASSASHSTEGASRVASAIVRHLREQHGVTIGIHQAEDAIRENIIQVKGRPIDLRPAIAAESAILASLISDAFSLALGRHAETVDAVLLVGGGAALVEPFLRKKYPHLIVPSMAQWAIARGLGHYARLAQSG